MRSKVNKLLVSHETLTVFLGILFSLPYGVLSDHWGRKPVLYLGILGILLSETWIRIVCRFRVPTAEIHQC